MMHESQQPVEQTHTLITSNTCVHDSREQVVNGTAWSSFQAQSMKLHAIAAIWQVLSSKNNEFG